MLYYDRVDVFVGIDTDKTSGSILVFFRQRV